MDSFNKAVDSYIDALKVKLEGKIDFEGQRSAEKWTQTLLSISTVSTLEPTVLSLIEI